MRIIQKYQNPNGPLELQKYQKWKKMTKEQKNQYRNNKAKAYLQSGPNIVNLWNAFRSYIGANDPENPNLITGFAPNATRATPQQVQQSAKLMETINNYWKNLGRLKVRLSGGKATSGILTKPGTAPTTFNGQNISYITSPKGGNVTHKFYTGQGSEYILTKDGFARRVKSPHNNTLGQGSGPTEWNAANSDAGLHNWNEGTTIFTEGEDGKLFNTAFYKLSDFGFKPGTYGLARKGEKARIMLIDPKTKQWRAAMLSDVYPTTVKEGLQADRVMETNYSDVPKLGWHILEKADGGWHPGSPVAFIEGLKQGGKMNILQFLKNGSGIHIKKENRGKFTDYCGGKVTSECIAKGKNSSNPTIRKRATFAANARKWKHKEGGKAFVKGVSILDSNPDAYKYVKKKYKMAQEGTKLTLGQKVGNFLNSDLGQFATNAAGQFVNGIWQNKENNKIKNELNQWKKSYINSIVPEDYSQQVAAEEQYLQQMNPDYNSSPIVQAYKNNILANNSLAAAKQKAEQEANQVIANYQLNNNSSFNWGNLLSQGLGLAGQYLSNKKQAT